MEEIRQEEEMIQEEIARRRKRGAKELVDIVNLGKHPVYSEFEVTATSDHGGTVRIRSITERLNSCTCADYRANTLGVCMHIEGVLAHLKKEFADQWDEFISKAPDVGRIHLHRGEKNTVRVTLPLPKGRFLRALLTRGFDAKGTLLGKPTRSLPALIHEIGKLPKRNRDRIFIEPEVLAYLNSLRNIERAAIQKRWFLSQVSKEIQSLNVLTTPLYNYQENGALHLAFGGRAILADEMGLGKTVQAIAAAALLQRLQDIQHVLVVCPASLKHQWAREIRRFTSLSVQVIEGSPAVRRDLYRSLKFFNIINYKQVRFDEAEILGQAFDLVILDEAGRIKNWRTKNAAGLKRLRSPYAFILTGSPLEDRLDDLFSIFQFIDPSLFGPRFRFYQEFCEVKRRAAGSYKVLGCKKPGELRRRIAPYIKRRVREDVLLDLPKRVDNNFYIEMSDPQWDAYRVYEEEMFRLMAGSRRAPLTPKESRTLIECLARMRVICNGLALHDPGVAGKDREKTAPKTRELAEILGDSLTAANRKAVLFSQWTGALDLVTPVLDKLKMGWVKLTVGDSEAERDDLIHRFFNDPACKVFLTTDAGSAGLDLQGTGMVINMDTPWSPAALNKRIDRAHRPGQPHAVNVVNLIARGAIEERVIDALNARKSLFEGTLDEDSAAIDLSLEKAGPDIATRLEALLGVREVAQPDLPFRADPKTPSLQGYADILLNHFPGRVLLVQKAPRLPYSPANRGVLVVVDREPARLRPTAESLLNKYFGEFAAPD
ncbi:MAG: DEAD/DEAH box helicase, partial [Desulfobacterales bacterium]|nr:DEAD/DEAH box helicase [Desulfobacterales bacterium]